MSDYQNKPASSSLQLPPPAQYQGDVPSQASLVARQEHLIRVKQRNISQIQAHRETHQSISDELGHDLQNMQERGRALEAFEQEAGESGVVSRLLRTFNRRSIVMQRRSMNEELVQRYESVSRCLRRASVFSDELQLSAIEMRNHIDEIHARLEEDRHDVTLCAQRVLDIERMLERMEHAKGDAEHERLQDQLHFEERVETGRLSLLRASLAMGKEELVPARALRNTAQEMHGEMSKLVLQVSSAVRSAGQQIQVLGMAADASIVVAELHESMAQLDLAMAATEQYIQNAKKLFTETVPTMTAEVQRLAGSRNILLTDDLEELSREQAKAMADRALMEAAEAEVDALTVMKTL